MKYLRKFNEDYETPDSCNIICGGSGEIRKVSLEEIKRIKRDKKETTYELTSNGFCIILQDVKTQEQAEEQLKYWKQKRNDPELRIKVIQNGKFSIL